MKTFYKVTLNKNTPVFVCLSAQRDFCSFFMINIGKTSGFHVVSGQIRLHSSCSKCKNPPIVGLIILDSFNAKLLLFIVWKNDRDKF